MAKRIGEALIEKGLITPRQLDEALRAQLIFGGHLGTNLIELGMTDEDALGQTLSQILRVPYAGPELLRDIPGSVLRCLPDDLVRRHQVVPIRKDANQLHVVAIATGQLDALDEIANITSQAIRPWIAPEIRVLEAMERYYDIRRQPRYVKLCKAIDGYTGTGSLWPAGKAGEIPTRTGQPSGEGQRRARQAARLLERPRFRGGILKSRVDYTEGLVHAYVAARQRRGQLGFLPAHDRLRGDYGERLAAHLLGLEHREGSVEQAGGIFDRQGRRYQVRSCTVASFGQASSFDIHGLEGICDYLVCVFFTPALELLGVIRVAASVVGVLHGASADGSRLEWSRATAEDGRIEILYWTHEGECFEILEEEPTPTEA